MLGMSNNPRTRAEKRLSRLARSGRHRADSLRESLPDPQDLMDDLRDQAQPVMERTRRSATDAVNRATGRKPARSKKPFALVALLVLAGVVAYVILNRRDKEPAKLVVEPDQPDLQPASGPSSPAAPVNGSPSNGSPMSPSTPSGSPMASPSSTATASTSASPTVASSAPSAMGAPTSNGSTAPHAARPSGASPTLGRTDVRPSPRMAAWDLPTSATPPSR